MLGSAGFCAAVAFFILASGGCYVACVFALEGIYGYGVLTAKENMVLIMVFEVEGNAVIACAEHC